MEETLKRKKPHNIEHVDDAVMRNAQELAGKLSAKYGGLVASAMVSRPGSNHSVFFVINDLNNVVVSQKIEEMSLAASEIAFSQKFDVKTEFILASDLWRRFVARDDALLDVMREYLVISDNGFMRPIQDMLVTGKVRPSKESVQVYFVKAEQSVKSADAHVSKAIIDLYWAVIDTAHAAVMLAGITPPSPEELAETVRKELVVRNLVHRRCADIVARFYEAAKQIMHRERFEVSGREFDSYLADAEFFIKEMNDFVKEHTKKKA
ncbi:hypothetical protein KY363_02260 [Candidatus Woesearchaeota archaeon]|nr:hypothetical protein [Candidatus Woesearchaeota archaeon]